MVNDDQISRSDDQIQKRTSTISGEGLRDHFGFQTHSVKMTKSDPGSVSRSTSSTSGDSGEFVFVDWHKEISASEVSPDELAQQRATISSEPDDWQKGSRRGSGYHIYEELSHFRKNIAKFLGAVEDEEEEPPALPSRPRTLSKPRTLAQNEQLTVAATISPTVASTTECNPTSTQTNSTMKTSNSFPDLEKLGLTIKVDQSGSSTLPRGKGPRRRLSPPQAETGNSTLCVATGGAIADPDYDIPKKPLRVASVSAGEDLFSTGWKDEGGYDILPFRRPIKYHRAFTVQADYPAADYNAFSQFCRQAISPTTYHSLPVSPLLGAPCLAMTDIPHQTPGVTTAAQHVSKQASRQTFLANRPVSPFELCDRNKLSPTFNKENQFLNLNSSGTDCMELYPGKFDNRNQDEPSKPETYSDKSFDPFVVPDYVKQNLAQQPVSTSVFPTSPPPNQGTLLQVPKSIIRPSSGIQLTSVTAVPLQRPNTLDIKSLNDDWVAFMTERIVQKYGDILVPSSALESPSANSFVKSNLSGLTEKQSSRMSTHMPPYASTSSQYAIDSIHSLASSASSPTKDITAPTWMEMGSRMCQQSSLSLGRNRTVPALHAAHLAKRNVQLSETQLPPRPFSIFTQQGSQLSSQPDLKEDVNYFKTPEAVSLLPEVDSPSRGAQAQLVASETEKNHDRSTMDTKSQLKSGDIALTQKMASQNVQPPKNYQWVEQNQNIPSTQLQQWTHFCENKECSSNLQSVKTHASDFSPAVKKHMTLQQAKGQTIQNPAPSFQDDSITNLKSVPQTTTEGLFPSQNTCLTDQSTMNSGAGVRPSSSEESKYVPMKGVQSRNGNGIYEDMHHSGFLQNKL